MILDHYLLPLIEISISIAIPLILTLKTLQITNGKTINENYSRHILTYWLNYWFLFCFIQSIGTNNHVRCCFSILYMAQYKSISSYLVKFYQESLIPQIVKTLLRLANIRITEVEVDYYATSLLENVCFNDQFIDKIMSVFKLGKIGQSNEADGAHFSLTTSLQKSTRKTIHRKPSASFNVSSHTGSRVASAASNKMGTPENIIPLEIQKPRAAKQNGNAGGTGGAGGGTPPKPPKGKKADDSNNAGTEHKKTRKKSNDNLRSKSSSTSLNGAYMKNSRSVSNEDGVIENLSSVMDPKFYNLDGPQISQVLDGGANLLMHGYNGDPFHKSSGTTLAQSIDKPERNRLRNFFNNN